MSVLPDSCDVVIVGAGAAGLAAAIFARRRAPGLAIVVLDGAPRPGAKILVSGGSRCNVTNVEVRESDFWGGRRTVIRRVLSGLSVRDTVAFFSDLGVALHEEDDGKLFPDSNRSRDVLNALLRGCAQAGVALETGARVHAISRGPAGFAVSGSMTGPGSPFSLRASRVVLATGGRSLPKTGSDGAGYAIAASLGHTIVPTTPALVPLIVDETNPYAIHERLAGVSHDVEITVRTQPSGDGAGTSERLRGALLWTHFGVSGPVALNASRHWARARLDGHDPAVTIDMFPGQSFERLEAAWIDAARERPRAQLRSLLGALPGAVGSAIVDVLGLDPATALGDLSRGDRRRLLHAVLAWPLAVTDTRGYNYAEVTAGGVALTEIDPASMESRVCPGLFLVGEILDVDGRIGGFNFQWAWASAAIAARAAFRLL